LAYQALAPELHVIAPWREWSLKSREDCLDYAEQRGIVVAASREINKQLLAELEPRVRAKVERLIPSDLTKVGRAELMSYF
jgi:hypothetical protein